MNKRPIIAAIAIAATAMVAVPTVASAANGGSWLLGRSNAESATTTVTNSAGTPLSLAAKSGYAPLKVNSGTVVTNLNTDKIDGLDSTAFAKAGLTTATIAHDGYYDGLGAKCPTGTKFVSGGGYIPGDSDFVWYSGPDWNQDTDKLIPNSWIVLGYNGVGTSNVTCLKPAGGTISGSAQYIDELFESEYYNDGGMLSLTAGKGQQLSDTAIAKVARVKELRSGK